MLKTKLIWMLCAPLFVTSCLNKVDLNNVNDIRYRGEWAVPLVQANLQLNDIVANDSTFTVDPDGGIRIIFEDDSLTSLEAKDLVTVPDQEPETVTITTGTPDVFEDFEMDAIEGVEFKSIEINSGVLYWKIDNPVNMPVKIELSILSATLNSDTAIFILDGNALDATSDNIDISGLNFDLTTGVLGYNNLSYRIRILNDNGAPTGTTYSITVQLKEFIIENAIGYFGNRSIPLPGSIVETHISGFANILNGLRIENPQLEFKITGNIGVPFTLKPDLEGINTNGVSTPLSISDIVYKGPSSIGDWDSSVVVINKGNSNIVDFIASVPSNISIAGDLSINPNGKTGTDNFVSKNSEIRIGMKMDIPLEIKSQNLTLEQWLYDIDWGLEDNELDFVEQLKIHLKVTNGFPFDANLKLVFYDNSSGLASDSIDVNLLTSAIVNSNGKVIEATISRSVIEFEQENIQNLLRSNKIRLVVTLNSYNNGEDLVKLYVTDFINVAVGVQTKVNYSL